MIIAVTYLGEEIFQHFGHCDQFKLYKIENDKIIDSVVVATNGQGHGALSQFLKELGVEVLICGGIGGGALNSLSEYGIKVFGGVEGSCDEAVNSFLSGNLKYDANVKCSHHDHSANHVCGDHGCGGNCGHGCH